jgi:CDP-6-deoxy-D-xylo-4-hexulose-3-dehydrase
MIMSEESTRKKIHELVKEFFDQKEKEFIPGKTPIYTGMAIYDEKEVNAALDSLLNGWFALSAKGKEFEDQLSKYLGNSFSILTNSGSSANLLALDGIRTHLGLNGGEIITPACTFPTTLNPIIQLGFRPAFLDVDKTLNITPEAVRSAINKNTKGIMFAHTLGNPAKVAEIMKIAKENNLFVVEDCSDALGSRYDSKPCGSWGTASTFSFYPAHNLCLGEGGAVSINDPQLYKIIRSLRDWGKDCWCSGAEHNLTGACGKRFQYVIDGIQYDHKYVFSQIGYNLKPLELQAAMGIEQMKRLDEFVRLRKRNFKIYEEEFSKFDEHFETVEINEKADPVLFGFPLIIKNPKIKRNDLTIFLNDNKIATRLLFSGNALRQPAYKNIKYSKYQDLKQSDIIMKDCFWIGLHPGITEEMINYVMSKFKEYLSTVR